MDFRNPILILLGSLIVHSHFRETSIGQALSVAALCAVYGYNLYLDTKKQEPINEIYKKELQDLRTIVGDLKSNADRDNVMRKAFGKK